MEVVGDGIKLRNLKRSLPKTEGTEVEQTMEIERKWYCY